MQTPQWIHNELSTLEDKAQRRYLRQLSNTGGVIQDGDKRYLNFSSNDYLDLANDPDVIQESRSYLETYGAGSTASRLIAGTLSPHTELESALADHKKTDSALVFGSGFLTNVGVIPSLVGRNDHIFVDRLAHASIIDGITLSRAHCHRFRHNDVAHLQQLLHKHFSSGRRLIITESVFSMDGDLAPLEQLAEVARDQEALLLIDDAHATGVFGPDGAGLTAQANVLPAVTASMGTLSKALGGYGGFVGCSAEVREFFVNRARSFIYSTALPPAVLGAALGALRKIRTSPGLREQLLNKADSFRHLLQQKGLHTGHSESQIIPVFIGPNDTTLKVAERLRNEGIFAVPIRPPTVPKGTARLRLSVTRAHTDTDLDRVVCLIQQAAEQEGVI